MSLVVVGGLNSNSAELQVETGAHSVCVDALHGPVSNWPSGHVAHVMHVLVSLSRYAVNGQFSTHAPKFWSRASGEAQDKQSEANPPLHVLQRGSHRKQFARDVL